MPVFFENEANIKRLRLKYVDLTVIDQPGDERLFLENLLVEKIAMAELIESLFLKK